MSVPGTRNDPIPGYNFTLSLSDSSSDISMPQGAPPANVGGFMEIQGIEATTDIEEYREGGRNDAVLKFPTRTVWANIVLRRGVGIDDDLFAWHMDYVQGRGARRDGLITLLSERRKPMRAWRFFRGIPIKWAGPALDAKSGATAIEELEIAHEGLELVAGDNLFGLDDVLSAGAAALNVLT